jgi:hypothetical protein
MEINLAATKQRVKDSGRTIVGWARARGLNTGTVAQFFGGHLSTQGPTGQRIISALRDDNLLEENDKAA